MLLGLFEPTSGVSQFTLCSGGGGLVFPLWGTSVSNAKPVSQFAAVKLIGGKYVSVVLLCRNWDFMCSEVFENFHVTQPFTPLIIHKLKLMGVVQIKQKNHNNFVCHCWRFIGQRTNAQYVVSKYILHTLHDITEFNTSHIHIFHCTLFGAQFANVMLMDKLCLQ